MREAKFRARQEFMHCDRAIASLPSPLPELYFFQVPSVVAPNYALTVACLKPSVTV